MSAKGKWLDGGEWAVLTMGTFVQLLVDGGRDVAICRIVEDKRHDGGEFSRRLDVWLVPQTRVAQTMHELGCTLAHDTVVQAMESGLIE